MNDEAKDLDNSDAGETPLVAPQAASPLTKNDAEPRLRVSPLQKLANLDAQRAEAATLIRKTETRGKIVIGGALISDAASDPKKVAYLKGLASKANDRDRIAIETACATLFRKAAAPQANPQAQR